MFACGHNASPARMKGRTIRVPAPSSRTRYRPAMWIVTGWPRPLAGLGSAASRATVPRSGRRKRENLRPCLGSDTSCAMEPATSKPIHFLGDSREALRDFPDDARYSAGTELRAVQTGLDPSDWKPIKTVGAGVREIRIREASGAFRVIYLATLPDRVLVLHAFQKKTQQTPQKDIDLAAKRLKIWKAEQ